MGSSSFCAVLLVALAAAGVSGQASTGGVTFENCEKLTAYKNVYWNVDSAKGLVTYAFEDKIPDRSWSSFGFNKNGATRMVPADVVLTTATTATDYDLSERSQCITGIGACPDTAVGGTDDVTLISAIRQDGISKIVLSKPLKTTDPKDLDLSASVSRSVQAIYASGPLDSDGTPNYHDPSVTGYSNGVVPFDLGRTPKLNCMPLLPDSAVTAGGSSNTTAPAPVASAVVPPLPAGIGCSITFGGQPRSFSVCREQAAGLTYRWNNLGGNMVEVATSCDHDGWCGFGIGRKMVGSSAIVAFPAGSNGVYVNNYLLAAKDEEAVRADTGVLRVGALAAEYVDGVLTMFFNLTLPDSQYPVASIIVAKGSDGDPKTGRINEHDTYLQGQVRWEDGTVSLDTHRGITRAHGILMIVVWVFFFPVGVLAARYLKHHDPLWFHLHRAFQGLGFVLFLIALGLSLKAKALNGKYSTPHKGLGVFLLVAVCLQVLAVVLRPKKGTKIRPAWNQYHHWLGRAALLLSVVQIYLGIYIFSTSAAFAAVYSVLWILVLLLFIGLEIWWRVRGPWSRRGKEPDALPQGHVPTNTAASFNGQPPYAFSVENEGRRF